MTDNYGDSGFYIRPMAYKQAVSYYTVGEALIDFEEKLLLKPKLSGRNISTEECFDFSPAIVNLSFACEIILKLLRLQA